MGENNEPGLEKELSTNRRPQNYPNLDKHIIYPTHLLTSSSFFRSRSFSRQTIS